MTLVHLRSITEARPYLRELWRTGQTVGSVHTLGALHAAHGELIKRSSIENDQTIVTVYPNAIQLFPGSVYRYDLLQDISLAERCGATVVISSDDAEMYPSGYATFIDQGPAATRLNSSVFSYASRGQITGAVRWISLCRPTASYFGMKDIEQSLLVKRAVDDLLIDCEIRQVPCVRMRETGVPVSSRLRFLPRDRLHEVGAVYDMLELGRRMVAAGESSSETLLSTLRAHLTRTLKTFDLVYLTVVDAATFGPVDRVSLPFILHCAISDGALTHFDGLYVQGEDDLRSGPEVIWLDDAPGANTLSQDIQQ